MNDKNPEMSLDEVLSSIKQMVTNEEPPVLELTDMVSKDGSIVKITKNKDANVNPDMSSFLRLIQENTNSTELYEHANNSAAKNPNSSATHAKHFDETTPMATIIKEVITPLLEKWIVENLQSIVTAIVKDEIVKFLYTNSKNKSIS